MRQLKKGDRSHVPHPYLQGNFAPIQRTLPLTPCIYSGSIPAEFAGGQYVRNGGNPVNNQDLARDAHMFDGDGMLSGVWFSKTNDGHIQPEFTNQYILTDVYLSTVTNPTLKRPILPSIATLINPASSFFIIIFNVIRTVVLVFLSHLSGSQQAIRKINVTNTGILYHDGRALATCESGPPMRVSLPTLQTVGWYDGFSAEGEWKLKERNENTFGGPGLLKFFNEWTTGHPRLDPVTKELILYHCTFVPPFVHYSIIPSTFNSIDITRHRMVNVSVPGIKSPKMMHDFGVSATHTVIMDLPLSLDPRNIALGKPIVSYDHKGCSRFGVFPRWNPSMIRWFESDPCCIFHTANTWDDAVPRSGSTGVNMLACRLTSPSLIFAAGNITVSSQKSSVSTAEDDECRLYYYRFEMSTNTDNQVISHQFALSAIPFEYPSVRDDVSMSNAQFVYGCSISDATFGAALGRSAKIDCLVKIDVRALITQGKKDSQLDPTTGCVDRRSVAEIIDSNLADDLIKVFRLPAGFYAQEPHFVPRKAGVSEDDGWIVSYVFDESQLDCQGQAPPNAKSELWVIDARDMKVVVAKICLPQRVPYGLHGTWFPESHVQNQRPIKSLRCIPGSTKEEGNTNSVEGILNDLCHDVWMKLRHWIIETIG